MKKKILFVSNISVVNNTIHCANWIKSLINNLYNDFDISFMISKNETHDVECIKGIDKLDRCYVIDSNYKNFEKHVKSVNDSLKPDLIQIFGTESNYSYDTFKALEKNNLLNKTIIFAQGFASECARNYIECLPKELINQWTFRDIVRNDNINKQIERYREQTIKENYILSNCRHFIGRTSLDYSLLKSNNTMAKYYKCNDIIDDCFYEDIWEYDKCIKHSIFVSQYYYPLKGFHILLEAVSKIKNKYPDIKIYAAGYNPIRKEFTKKELRDSSYIRYIKKLIKEYKLEKNICLLGNLSSEQMKEQYLKSNVFVMPSTVENSPNSMAEAMLLGVPSILSNVGGVKDYVTNNVDAYIYETTDIDRLSKFIEKVFDEKENMAKISYQGRKRALKDYDRQANTNRFIEVYNEIINSNEQ